MIGKVIMFVNQIIRDTTFYSLKAAGISFFSVIVRFHLKQLFSHFLPAAGHTAPVKH